MSRRWKLRGAQVGPYNGTENRHLNPMKNPLRILHVEDSPKDAELVKAILEEAGIACDTLRVEASADYVSGLEQRRFDTILGDSTMPGFDGLSALKIAQEKCSDVPFIFVS